MEITVDDVKNLTFEVYMLQRELTVLRAENAELQNLLKQATKEPAEVANGSR